MRSIDRDRARAAVVEVEPALTAKASVTVMRFAGFDGDGRFLVDGDGVSRPLVALSTVRLASGDFGCDVVVSHRDGDARRPIILGRALQKATPDGQLTRADGERLVIRGEREIELRCGDASIILTRAGKVLIRGTYVLSRSRGANKIKGAFVDIN